MKYSFEAVNYDYNIPAKVLIQHKPGHRCRKHLHWHNEIEIVYMVKGEMNVNLGGQIKTIRDGELYFANSEELHRTWTPEYIDINYYIVILMSFDFMKNYYKKIDGMYFDVNENPDAQHKLAEIIKNMVPVVENRPPFFELTLNSQVSNIYQILLSECMQPKKNTLPSFDGPNFSYAKQAIEYIAENFKKDITLKEIASVVGVTPTYFSNYFKSITEFTFIQYLNGVRLEHALRDIIHSDISVKDSAQENGFPNVKSFITQCKKVYGCTPTEYKNKTKNSK